MAAANAHAGQLFLLHELDSGLHTFNCADDPVQFFVGQASSSGRNHRKLIFGTGIAANLLCLECSSIPILLSPPSIAFCI